MAWQKSPAFRFYAADFLMDEKVRLMNLQERGAYITLLSHCWVERSIPNNIEELSLLCNIDARDFENIWERVSKCFKKRGKRLINNRLEIERAKQLAYSRSQSVKGKKAHATDEAVAEPEPKKATAVVQPARARFSFSSSSSFTDKTKDSGRSAPKPSRFSKPTAQEVTAYALSVGYRLKGQDFINHYEAGGWMRGKTRMVNWKAAVQVWKSKADPRDLVGAISSRPSIAAQDQAVREAEDAKTKAEHEAHDRAIEAINALPKPDYDAIYAEAVKRLPSGSMAERLKGSLLPMLMVQVWREKAVTV